jgi:thiol-disulfide isomerase/thioredoxin
MLRISSVVLFSTITFIVQAQGPGQFTLNGEFTLPDSGFVYLAYMDGSGKYRKDSCKVSQGSFSIRGTVAHPTFARLYYAGKELELFLEPSDIHVKVNVPDFSENIITGSKSHQEFELFQAAQKKINRRWQEVIDTITAVNKRSNVAAQELKGRLLPPYFEEMKAASCDFYSRHPASFVTAYELIFTATELTTDSLYLFYNRFPADVRQSAYGKAIQERLEKRKLGVPGAMAAGFVLPDLQGNKLSLADFRGKYVLLDFWGSWCVPCRKSHPHLKELYSKYKVRGIEFIGVAQEYASDNSAWRKAIEEDKLNWPQVLTDKTVDGNVVAKYNIEYFPTKILIDKEGKIIGRFGEGQMGELDKMLAGIFNGH